MRGRKPLKHEMVFGDKVQCTMPEKEKKALIMHVAKNTNKSLSKWLYDAIQNKLVLEKSDVYGGTK